jgi:hypothetical protein
MQVVRFITPVAYVFATQPREQLNDKQPEELIGLI